MKKSNSDSGRKVKAYVWIGSNGFFSVLRDKEQPFYVMIDDRNHVALRENLEVLPCEIHILPAKRKIKSNHPKI